MKVRPWWMLVLPFTIAACDYPTQAHVLARGDQVRFTVDCPSDGSWRRADFDDRAWSTAVLPFAAPAGASELCLRKSFTVGLDAPSYRTLRIDGEALCAANDFGLALAGSARCADGVSQPLAAGENQVALRVRPPQTVDLTVALERDTEAGSLVWIAKGPFYLPAADALTVVWETSQPARSTLVLSGERLDGGSEAVHRVTLPGHAAGSRYTLEVEQPALLLERIGVDVARESVDRSLAARSPALQLPSLPAAELPLRIAMLGDTRTGGDDHRRTIEAIVGAQPDLLVHTGDLIWTPNEREWRLFFDIEVGLLQKVPLLPTLGNHELRGGDGHRYTELMAMPGAPSPGTYSVDVGGVHWVMLDSNHDFAPQARWLDADLAAVEARADVRFAFVVLHWGPYSSGPEGPNEEARRALMPVLRRHPVDAIFSGHAHLYERGHADGLPYFVTGGGGSPLDDINRGPEAEVVFSQYHYLTIDIAANVAQVRAYDLRGRAFDEVSLPGRRRPIVR